LNGLANGVIASIIAGIFGTTTGAFIAVLINKIIRNKNSYVIENITKSLLGFSGGLMIVIVCFDLIPSAYELSSFYTTFIGVLAGTIIIPILDIAFYYKRKSYRNKYHKVGLTIFLSIAMHNLPEGLALGAGFGASQEFGIALAIVIAMHNIPEGLAMATPMLADRQKAMSILAYAFICGVPTVLGSFAGGYFAEISSQFIGICLGFAAGAMMYVVVGEMFPLSYNKSFKINVIYIIVGFIVGLMLTK